MIGAAVSAARSHPATIVAAGLLGSTSRTVYLIVAALVVIGIVMIGVAVWLVRVTRARSRRARTARAHG